MTRSVTGGYSVSANLTTIKNKVKSLVQDGYSIIAGDKQQSYTMAGYPIGHFSYEGKEFDGEWRSVDGSDYYQSPKLYKENGFKERTDAAILCQNLGYPKEDGDGCFLPEPPAEAGT